MTRLEIIHLRSSGEPVEALTDRIHRSIQVGGEDSEAVTLYRCHGLDTDLAVHVLRPGVTDERRPSELGLRLASALRAYGLVEHTVWEELR